MTMPPELTPGALSAEVARLQHRDEDLIEQMGLIMNGWKAEAASRRTAASQGSPGGSSYAGHGGNIVAVAGGGPGGGLGPGGASRGSPGGARVVNYGAYNEGYADALTACAEALKLLRDHLEETS